MNGMERPPLSLQKLAGLRTFVTTKSPPRRSAPKTMRKGSLSRNMMGDTKKRLMSATTPVARGLVGRKVSKAQSQTRNDLNCPFLASTHLVGEERVHPCIRICSSSELLHDVPFNYTLGRHNNHWTVGRLCSPLIRLLNPLSST